MTGGWKCRALARPALGLYTLPSLTARAELAYPGGTVRRVTVNGVSYAMPFQSLLPQQSPEVLQGLEQSILSDGVLDPIDVGTTPTHGRVIIDGNTRAMIAEKHGLRVHVNDRGEVSDEQARRWAEDLNEHRRHLTKEQHAEALAKRLKRKKLAGMTVRAMAKEEGIPPATAHRLLHSNGGTSHYGTSSPEEEWDAEDDIEDDDSLPAGNPGNSLPPTPKPPKVADDRPAPKIGVKPTADGEQVAIRRTTERFLRALDNYVADMLEGAERGLSVDAIHASAKAAGIRFHKGKSGKWTWPALAVWRAQLVAFAGIQEGER